MDDKELLIEPRANKALLEREEHYFSSVKTCKF